MSYLAAGRLGRKEAGAAILEGGHRSDNGEEWTDFPGPCERLDARW